MDWIEVFEKLIEIEKMLRFTETHAKTARRNAAT